MKRISAKCARPGQVLSYAVYDSYGKKLLDENTKLDKKAISILAENWVSEIIVEDPRTDDIRVVPLVSPELEGRAAKAVKQTYLENYGRSSISLTHLKELRETAAGMVRAMEPMSRREIAIAPVTTESEYTFLQPVKTAEISVGLGQALEFSEAVLEDLALASLLKDTGYIKVPREIFMKAGAISIAETLRMREHCRFGHEILSQNNCCSQDVATAVLQHHERWSGQGYPGRLKENQISSVAQIIALADQYASLLSRRPGRKVYASHEAVEYVMAFSGEYFNPDMVKAFMRKVSCYGNGLMVKINTGETGIVSNPETGIIGRPVVRVFPDGKNVTAAPYDINLAMAENRQKMITEVLEYSF
jgi:HD-GYP domain-containing protein (c-di-GMP phosphodiesterase class II)